VHAHCTVWPQLFVIATPQAPLQGSTGVQHACWAQTRPEPHELGHCTWRPQLSVANVPHWLPHAAELLGEQHPPSDRHTCWSGCAQRPRPSNPQLTV
jgi:hypothetical protein